MTETQILHNSLSRPVDCIFTTRRLLQNSTDEETGKKKTGQIKVAIGAAAMANAAVRKLGGE